MEKVNFRHDIYTQPLWNRCRTNANGIATFLGFYIHFQVIVGNGHYFAPVSAEAMLEPHSCF